MGSVLQKRTYRRLRVGYVLGILAFALVALGPAAGAAVIFQDDFDDGIVGPEYAPIGAAVLSESGGWLRADVFDPAAGGGLSVRLPAPLDSHCGLFDGFQLPPTVPGDWIHIDLVADAGAGLYVDSSITLMHSQSITVAVKDKNGKVLAFHVPNHNPEDIKRQWIDKIGTKRIYEIEFKDGSRWLSPAYDPPEARIAGYDVTTNVDFMSFDAFMADDVHRPRNQLPADAVMAIDVLGTFGSELLNAEILLGSEDFPADQVDLATVNLVSLDQEGNVLGVAPYAAQPMGEVIPLKNDATIDRGVLRLSFSKLMLPLEDAGYLALEGLSVDGEEWRAVAPAAALPDAEGYMQGLGLMDPDVLLTVEATGPHLADGLDTAVITVTATDSVTGLPVDGLEIEVRAGAGIDHEELLEAVPLGSGLYEAYYSTTIAGTNSFLAEAVGVIGSEAEAGQQFDPGLPVTLDVKVGDFVFPDGVTPLLVTVSPRDPFGNIVGPGFANVLVDAPSAFTISTNVCDEHEIGLFTTEPGSFEVTVTETTSGLSETVPVRFPVIGPRAPSDNPWTTDEGVTSDFSMPVEFHLPPTWPVSELTIGVDLDPGMVALATLVDVRDEVSDCVDLLGWTAEDGVDGSLDVTVLLANDLGCVPTSEASSFTLDFATTGNGVLGDLIEGFVTISSFQGDALHPYYGTWDLPFDDFWGYECVCEKKDVWEGCIIYVRGQAPTQPSKKDICDTHNLTNTLFSPGCISFTKTVTDIVLSDPSITQHLNTNDEYNAAIDFALAALSAAGVNRGNCLVVVRVDDLGPKGVSGVVGSEGAGSPRAGVSLVEDTYFGTRTPAHEVGHQVDERAGEVAHNEPADNLMHPIDRGATGEENLNQAQIDRYRNSKWLTKKVQETYY